MEELIEKVVAYITRGDELLVFRHTQHPEAGIQVPAGTLDSGEKPEEAVLRECAEETGLTDFQPPEFLDIHEFTITYRGKPERIRRYFFHVIYDQETPEKWKHFESDPSVGPTGPIEFEFFWVKLPYIGPALSGELGSFLYKLHHYNR